MPLDYLTCFVMVLHGYMGTFDIHKTDYGLHSKLKTFPLSWSHTGSTTFKNYWKVLTKFKEKWSTVRFDIFNLSFINFIPVSQTISVINRSGTSFFYMHQTSGACAGVYVCNSTHQMEKTVKTAQFLNNKNVHQVIRQRFSYLHPEIVVKLHN